MARKEFDGTNSEIREHHYPDGTRLVVTRLGARKGGFSFDEAHEVIRDVKQYYEELLELGIPVSEIKDCFVEYEPSLDRSVVVKTSPWAGHEVKRMIADADPKKDREMILNLVAEMVVATKPVALKRHGYELTTGIDPHASNFIRDDEGTMRFVDLFPPRIRKADGPLVEWPSPKTELGKTLGHFKHFDIRGVMLTMSAQLARIRPELKAEFERSVFGGFREALDEREHQEFMREVENSPWLRVRESLARNDLASCAEVISESLDARPFGVSYNVYTLREIALELAAKGYLSDEELESFFKDSHFEDTLEEERLESLKERLIGALRRGGA